MTYSFLLYLNIVPAGLEYLERLWSTFKLANDFQFKAGRNFDLQGPWYIQLQLSIKQELRNLIFFQKYSTCYKNVKLRVLTLQCYKVGENYGRKIMHGVMKTKGINVGETKIGKILGEINREAQRKR